MKSMFPVSSAQRVLVCATYLLVIGGAIGASAFENPSERPVNQVLPAELARSTLHKVLDPIASDGYLDQFEIESRFGRFSAIGRAQLRKRIHEIAALDEIDKISKTKVFVDSAAAAGLDTVKSITSAFVDPKATFKALPKGVGRLFARTKASVERGVDEVSRRASGEPREDAKALFARNARISLAERNWSRKLGIDPYSTNLTVRDAVSQVALVDSAASFTVGLAIPGVASIGVDILAELSDELWSKAPSELAAANRERLLAAGFDHGGVTSILANEWYTPTWRTVLSSSVAALSGVENVRSTASVIQSVQSFDEARFVAQSVAMLAWYHTSQTPLAVILDDPRLPHAIDANGTHVALLPLDHLFATAQAVAAVERLSRGAATQNHQLWVSGTLSAQALAALDDANWSVKESAMHVLMSKLGLRG